MHQGESKTGYSSREHGGQPLGDNELLLYLA